MANYNILNVMGFKGLQNCTNCHLHNYRKFVVLGKGTMPADLLFLCDAPDRIEDSLGSPLAGQRLKFLNMMLRDATRISFRQLKNLPFFIPSYYIVNCILCHPCDGNSSNFRAPEMHEILACQSNIQGIIKKVNTNFVVFIGKQAGRFYKEYFTQDTTLLDIGFLLKTGGRGSSWYNQNLIRLSKLITLLIKEKNEVY